ncbi:IS1 family transposase, partial [Escherichia marmotae]
MRCIIRASDVLYGRVNIHCPCCQSAQVCRHGQNPECHDR